jgi:hypothetical protein
MFRANNFLENSIFSKNNIIATELEKVNYITKYWRDMKMTKVLYN